MSQETCPFSWRPCPQQTVFTPIQPRKTDCFSQTPNRQASVSSVAFKIVVLKTTPTAHAAPDFFHFIPECHAPSLPSALRWPAISGNAVAREPPSPPIVCIRIPKGWLTGLATPWAVGVFAADTCGRRFLLVLSGALRKRYRLRRWVYILHPWISLQPLGLSRPWVVHPTRALVS